MRATPAAAAAQQCSVMRAVSRRLLPALAGRPAAATAAAQVRAADCSSRPRQRPTLSAAASCLLLPGSQQRRATICPAATACTPRDECRCGGRPERGHGRSQQQQPVHAAEEPAGGAGWRLHEPAGQTCVLQRIPGAPRRRPVLLQLLHTPPAPLSLLPCCAAVMGASGGAGALNWPRAASGLPWQAKAVEALPLDSGLKQQARTYADLSPERRERLCDELAAQAQQLRQAGAAQAAAPAPAAPPPPPASAAGRASRSRCAAGAGGCLMAGRQDGLAARTAAAVIAPDPAVPLCHACLAWLQAAALFFGQPSRQPECCAPADQWHSTGGASLAADAKAAADSNAIYCDTSSTAAASAGESPQGTCTAGGSPCGRQQQQGQPQEQWQQHQLHLCGAAPAARRPVGRVGAVAGAAGAAGV